MGVDSGRGPHTTPHRQGAQKLNIADLPAPAEPPGAPVPTEAPVPVVEAARKLGLSPGTIVGWHDGTPECPVKRFGRNFYVIAAWLELQTTCDLGWRPPGVSRTATAPAEAVA